MTTIDEALTEFDLINGAGSKADKQACAMTLLSWVHDKTWTDHPASYELTQAGLIVRKQ